MPSGITPEICEASSGLPRGLSAARRRRQHSTSRALPGCGESGPDEVLVLPRRQSLGRWGAGSAGGTPSRYVDYHGITAGVRQGRRRGDGRCHGPGRGSELEPWQRQPPSASRTPRYMAGLQRSGRKAPAAAARRPPGLHLARCCRGARLHAGKRGAMTCCRVTDGPNKASSDLLKVFAILTAEREDRAAGVLIGRPDTAAYAEALQRFACRSGSRRCTSPGGSGRRARCLLRRCGRLS